LAGSDLAAGKLQRSFGAKNAPQDDKALFAGKTKFAGKTNRALAGAV